MRCPDPSCAGGNPGAEPVICATISALTDIAEREESLLTKRLPILSQAVSNQIFDALAPYAGAAADPLGNSPVPPPPSILPLSEEIAGLSRFWAAARTTYGFWGRVTPEQWDIAYQETLERLLAAGPLPTTEYYDWLEVFAACLGDGHTGILPPPALYQRRSRPGLRLDWVGDQLVVADSALIPPGTILTEVDGEPIGQVYDRVARTVSASTPHDLAAKVADRFLRRDPGTSIQLAGRQADGQFGQWTVTADYAEDVIQPVTAQLVTPDITHIDLPHFRDAAPVVAFDDTFPHFNGIRGIIIDLRSNRGGSSGWGLQILSRLIHAEIPLWRARIPVTAPVLESWGLPARWELQPSAGTLAPHTGLTRFDGPVAVLTSPRTYSAAEDFVVAFRAAQRGVVIGQTTGGSSGQPAFFPMPGGGWGFVCGVWNLAPDGTEFVQTGLVPDIVAEPSLHDYVVGRDGALEQAVAWIEQVSSDRPQAGPTG